MTVPQSKASPQLIGAGPQDSFSVVAATLPSQNASAASPEVLFALRQLHDVGGILNGEELAAAGQRDRIGEGTLPARRCHQANSSAPASVNLT